MGKLRVLSGQETCAILAAHGFVEVQRQDEEGTVTVPVPDHRELRTGTLRSIIRQSGLPRGEFEA